MKRMIPTIPTNPLLVALALGCLLLPTTTQALECPELRARLARAIPASVGDAEYIATLLQPKANAPQMSHTFDPERAAKAVGDRSFLEQSCCGGCGGAAPHPSAHDATHGSSADHHATPDCTYGGTDGGSQLRVVASEGRYVYLDPARSHRGFNPNEIPQARAIEATRDVLTRFGVPRDELDSDRVEARDLVLAAQALGSDGQLTGEPRKARAEVHVIVPRQIDGTRVFDSFGRAAIDAKGQVARLHVNWPDFCVSRAARSTRVRGHAEMVDAVMAEILASGSCNTVGAVGASIGYVQERSVADWSGLGADDESTGDDACFVPGLVVSVAGPEAGEGELSLAGQILTLPLIDSPGDGKPTVARID